jgi:hypothetical protein
MMTHEPREALNELNRKLLLLKTEKYKANRNKMIDSILDSENGEVPCLAQFLTKHDK